MNLIEKLQGLIELRAAAWEAAKKHNDANEIEAYHKAEADVEKQDVEIARVRKMIDIEERGRKSGEGVERRVKPAAVSGQKEVDWENDVERRSSPEYRGAFGHVLRHKGELPADLDKRAVRMAFDYKGGFFMAPNEVESDIIKAVLDQTQMLKVCSVRTIDGLAPGSNGMVMRSRMSGGGWGTELNIGSEVDDLDMDMRAMFPHPLSCYCLISNDLLEITGDTPIQFIKDEISEANAIVKEDAFLYGTGSKQPLGLMVASAQGVSTAYDVAVGSVSNLTADGLFNVQYDLRDKYQGNAHWGFHRTAIRELRKLKDGEGQYLWQPGLQAGQPNLLLGKPILVQERLLTFASWSSGLYAGWYGDPKYYRVLRRPSYGFKTDASRYVELNQTIVIMREHLDGQPLIGEAFRRVKLSVS